MNHNCELFEQSSQPILVIHTQCAVENLPVILGDAYGSIMRYLSEINEVPGGAPFVTYFNMDMQKLDIEIGFPVQRPLPARDQIISKVMPAGNYASVIHKGPYPEMGKAYEALNRFLAEKGIQPSGVVYEFYLNDPMEVAPEGLMTKIVFPILSN